MIKFEKLPADILSRISAVRKILAEEQNVVFAYLFGGLARGEVKPLSDIDIAVFLEDVVDTAAFKLDLFDKLTDVLGTGELDLVILNTTPVSLSGRILMDRQILVDKDPFRRHLYESVTLREFFDFRMKEDAIFTARYGVGR
jgi:predicted nucleotidyltransferase